MAGRSGITSFEDFAREVNNLYASPDTAADASLQVMTIHKAKGLEFDTVILPGLGRPPQPERRPLLLWQERTATDGARDLLLAPIGETGGNDESIYTYIRGLNAEKQRHENVRLAYVAMTRARDRLHLLGHTIVHHRSGNLNRPSRESLLFHLWPALEPWFVQGLEAGSSKQTERRDSSEGGEALGNLRRLTETWALPSPPSALDWRSPGEFTSEGERSHEALLFDWAGQAVRQIGTVVHLYLQEICRTGTAAWDSSRLERERPRIRWLLDRGGMDGSELEQAAGQVEDALRKTLSDERGLWVLAGHRSARSELALSGMIGGRLVNVVLDRTFIDESGLRWIIDFKAGLHSGGEPGAFLDRERERYRSQLETYAALLSREESRPVRLGLYFPRLQGWREWAWGGGEPLLAGR